MLIMSCFNVKVEKSCFIGEVACGKTSIIRFFSKIMGKKLTLYAIDEDSDSSVINVRPKILDKIEKMKLLK